MVEERSCARSTKPCRLRPDRNHPQSPAAVSSRIAGRVIDVKVSDGESVKKGQVVVKWKAWQLGDPPPRVQYAARRLMASSLTATPQGDSVEPNKHLMEIVDLSEVYAEGRIFEGTNRRD